MKLFYKLLIITLAPLICIGGLCNVYFAKMYNQIESHFEEKIIRCVQDITYHFQTEFSYIHSLASIIAKDVDIQKSSDNVNSKRLLNKTKQFMQFNVSGILCVDEFFQTQCQVGKLPVTTKTLKQSFFQNAHKESQTGILEIDNQLYALSVFPFENQQGFVVVGKCVYPDIYDAIKNHLNIQFFIRYQNTTIGMADHRVSVGYWKKKTMPIHLNDTTLHITIYKHTSLLQTIIDSRKKVLFFSFIALVIFSLSIAVLMYRLIHPINNLIHAMDLYSKGELRLSSLPDVKNEIGKLYQAFHRMIINLEHAEQRYQRIFEYAIEGLFQTHPDGYFIRANPSLAKIFGYTTPEDLLKNVYDLSNQLYVHPEDRNRFKDSLSKYNKVNNYEVQMYKKNGEIIWVQINARSVRSKDGDMLYYEGFLVDIDERKKAEQKDQERKALEMANQTKSEFLASISHEIRTPLNAVIGLGKLLKKTSLTDLQKDYLTDMLSSSQMLLELINDILDYSRVELDKIKLMTTPFSLLDIYQNIIAIFKHQVQSKQMAMICHIASECGIELIGDPIRIKQILVNLVGNAVKFTNNGQVWIQTESLHQTLDRIYISISVTDTGIGIQEADQKQIFQAFTQAESNINRKYSGAGLGLAICEKLVQIMDGKLFVSSTPLKGSTFTITLPFSFTDLKKQPRIPYTNSRVLMVEDDPSSARFARSILEDENITVDILEDSHQLCAQIQNSSYDLIFMDIQLPEKDGFELTQRIRAEGHVTLPIIAITACSLKGDREKCLAAGMNDYLAKPYEPEDIIKMYHKWKASVQPLE